jgi:hypothetical protein
LIKHFRKKARNLLYLLKIKVMNLLHIIGMIGIGELFILGSLIAVLSVFALINLLRSKFEGNIKIVWLLLIILLPLLGALLYFIIGRKQRIR